VYEKYIFFLKKKKKRFKYFLEGGLVNKKLSCRGVGRVAFDHLVFFSFSLLSLLGSLIRYVSTFRDVSAVKGKGMAVSWLLKYLKDSIVMKGTVGRRTVRKAFNTLVLAVANPFVGPWIAIVAGAS
jgi:hypothetical protein